ncbi:hypothetical protein HJC04_26320 [Rhizobium sp. NLR8a]|uniref:hypothetical protein n=1 Tax=Rhizobium sp. NLR8a TaxID=2731119 RepID=UPI001C8333AE|nr:hypothetical protein [Rhizobium sp. NLR8a]MBX5223795.1 hypothetical protein [Rhizobium sp. NLR8a]
MAYVTRSADGEIAGLYEQPQEGYAEEFLPDDNSEVVAFSERSEAALAASRTEMLRHMRECK